MQKDNVYLLVKDAYDDRVNITKDIVGFTDDEDFAKDWVNSNVDDGADCVELTRIKADECKCYRHKFDVRFIHGGDYNYTIVSSLEKTETLYGNQRVDIALSGFSDMESRKFHLLPNNSHITVAMYTKNPIEVTLGYCKDLINTLVCELGKYCNNYEGDINADILAKFQLFANTLV